MICHVCEQQAIGQCKSCGKFYCKQHGDVYCVRCSTAVKPEGQPLEREVEFGVQPKPTPTPAPAPAPRCHACEAAADRACSKCGVFFCPQHGGLHATRNSWSAPLCNACADNESTWLTCIWIYAAVVVIGAIIAFAAVFHH